MPTSDKLLSWCPLTDPAHCRFAGVRAALVLRRDRSVRLQFLLLQLSGGTEIFYPRTLDRTVELKGRLVVVLNPYRRAEIDAEVEASLAVNINGALTGTMPDATSLPLAFRTTLSGPAGLRST